MLESNPYVRSEEVQDILGATPGWMVRWGMIVLALFFLGGIIVAAIFKYPDVIEGDAIITSRNPPVKVINKMFGIIDHIFVTNNQEVKQGDILLEIKSALEKDDLQALRMFIMN